jgi:hypothetical protein
VKVVDPGHVYELEWLDGEPDTLVTVDTLTFVKREGPGYPGNVGRHSGTTIQEVLRALIDRMKYVDNQIPHLDNKRTLQSLRFAILFLEMRAAERHGRELTVNQCPELFDRIEDLPVCPKCLHIGCEGDCHP